MVFNYYLLMYCMELNASILWSLKQIFKYSPWHPELKINGVFLCENISDRFELISKVLYAFMTIICNFFQAICLKEKTTLSKFVKDFYATRCCFQSVENICKTQSSYNSEICKALKVHLPHYSIVVFHELTEY